MIRFILRSLLRLAPGSIVLLAPVAALTHETWLEPAGYQATVGETIGIDIINGQHFNGMKLPWLDRGIERFVAIDTAQSAAAERVLTGRLGDRPAVQLALPNPGLVVVGLRSGLDRLVYADWAKFAAFATEKGLGDALVDHRARGLPETGFAEVYRRFAKTLIAAAPDGAAGQSVAGADRALGFETEFVALENPYAPDFTGPMRALLLADGRPRAGARVTVFDRAPAGGTAQGQVREGQYQTDAEGIVRLPVQPGHVYLLDAVDLQPAPAGTDAAWLSRWAALTFAVPGQTP